MYFRGLHFGTGVTDAFKSAFLISCCILIVTEVSSQHILKGKVIDNLTREPLQLAVITDSRTHTNVTTGDDGNFLLKDMETPDSISVSFIGYRSRTFKIDGTENKVVFGLEKGPVDLKEITITSHAENLAT